MDNIYYLMFYILFCNKKNYILLQWLDIHAAWPKRYMRNQMGNVCIPLSVALVYRVHVKAGEFQLKLLDFANKAPSKSNFDSWHWQSHMFHSHCIPYLYTVKLTYVTCALCVVTYILSKHSADSPYILFTYLCLPLAIKSLLSSFRSYIV